MVVAGSSRQHARLRAFSADTFVCKAGYTFSSTLFSRSMSSVSYVESERRANRRLKNNNFDQNKAAKIPLER
jgi:hypothetical protein